MSVQVEVKDDVVVIAPRGKLMGGPECDELKSVVEKNTDEGYKKMVIDFAEVGWVNSSGIGAVISCYLTLKRLQGDLKLARPTERVKYYLHISKLDSLFAVYDSVEDAINTLK